MPWKLTAPPRPFLPLAVIWIFAVGGASAQAQTFGVPNDGSQLSRYTVPKSMMVELEIVDARGTSDGLWVWRWPTGQAMSFVVGGGRFVAQDRDRPNGLLRELERWDELTEVGFAFENADIVRGRNRLGPYYYVQDDLDDLGLRCLFFRQGIPALEQPGYEAASQSMSGGEISGFDCRPTASITAAAHAELWEGIIDTGGP